MRVSRALGLAIAATFLFTISAPALAYVDSGTGSLFVQAAISGMLGALFVIRTSWSSIRALFVRKRAGEDDRQA